MFFILSFILGKIAGLEQRDYLWITNLKLLHNLKDRNHKLLIIFGFSTCCNTNDILTLKTGFYKEIFRFLFKAWVMFSFENKSFVYELQVKLDMFSLLNLKIAVESLISFK